MDELMQTLMGYDWGSERSSLYGLDQEVAAAHGDDAKRGELEKRFLAVLASEAALPAKEYVCRQLALMGTANSVPVLAKMVLQGDTTDMARMALEQIPAPEASTALLEALPQLTGAPKAGVAASLGQRHETRAVPALLALLKEDDEAVAVSSAQALGQIADGPTSKGLIETLDGLSGKVLQCTLDAYLRCADRMVRESKLERAQVLYKAVANHPNASAAIKLAAAQGLEQTTPKGATS